MVADDGVLGQSNALLVGAILTKARLSAFDRARLSDAFRAYLSQIESQDVTIEEQKREIERLKKVEDSMREMREGNKYT